MLKPQGLWILIVGFFMICRAAAAERIIVIDIPAQSMSDALLALAEQADISIGFGGVDIQRYRSKRLVGAYNPRQALERLFAQTDLTFTFVDTETVRIDRLPSQSVMPKAGRSIESIIVTATKRSADPRRLPVSVVALRGERLEAFGVESIGTLAPQIAGVSLTNLGPGRNKIFVRGLSDGTFVDRTQSTVGVYLDESPIIFNDTNPDIRLSDIDRVEVVRGPQGTLYGAGSIGGAYRIITNKPDLDAYSSQLRGGVSATKDGGVNSSLSAMTNVPLVGGRLALRASGYGRFNEGYIDDVGIGGSNVNESDIYGARAGLRAKFSDHWLLDIAVNHQSINIANTQYYFERLGAFRRDNSLAEPYDDRFSQLNTTLRGQYDWGEIVSATSFIRRDIDNQSDATRIVPALIGAARGPSPYNLSKEISSWTHETRLLSASDRRVLWLIGLYLSDRGEDLTTSLRTLRSVAPGTEILFSERRRDDVEEFALFGEASLRLFDPVTLTAGVRWFNTDLKTRSMTMGSLDGAGSLTDGGNTQDGFRPKLALSYQATEDVLIYGQAAQGYRVGGVNINTPVSAIEDPDEGTDTFESDRLWNLELGVKSQWLDDRIAVNAAIFRVLWEDIQTDQLLDNGFTFVTNAGDARINGVELDVAAQVTQDFAVNGNLFWNNSKFLEANEFLGIEADSRLPGIPEFSAGISGTYGFDLPKDIRGTVSLDYSYIGESRLTYRSDDVPKMGDYHLINARFQADKDEWTAGLFVNNLTNEKGNTFSFGNPFSLAFEDQITPVRPLTAGIFLEKRF